MTTISLALRLCLPCFCLLFLVSTMVDPSASTLDSLARIPPLLALDPLACHVIFKSRSLCGAALFLRWDDCLFYVMQDGCSDRSRFDNVSLALDSISRFKKPGVEAVAVRQCAEFHGPAMFLSEEDCSFFLERKAFWSKKLANLLLCTKSSSTFLMP